MRDSSSSLNDIDRLETHELTLQADDTTAQLTETSNYTDMRKQSVLSHPRKTVGISDN